MRYIQFTSFIVFTTFSYHTYGMDLSEDQTGRTQVQFDISADTVEEFLKSIPYATVNQVNSPVSEERPVVRIPINLPQSEYQHLLESHTIQFDDTYTFPEYYTEIGANNAHFSLGHQNKLELEKLIKENFTRDKDDVCQPNLNLQMDQVLHNKLKKFIDVYSYDYDLKFMVGRAFFKNETLLDFENGLYLFAQGIVSQYHQEGTLASDEIQTYLYNWRSFTIDRVKCAPLLNTILLLTTNPQQYITKNNIRKNPQRALKNALLDNCQSFFSALQTYSDNCIYGEAAFFCIKGLILAKESWSSSIFLELADYLYNKLNLNLKKIPLSITMDSAEYLYTKKKFPEAIVRYKSVLEDPEDSDNFFQTSHHYNLWGTCLVHTKQYDPAHQAFGRALNVEDDPLKRPQLEWNVALANILCENYDNTILDTIKKIFNFSKEERGKYNITLPASVMNLTYQYALEKAGYVDELNQLLLFKQREAIEKLCARNRTQGAFIKARLEESRQLEQQRQATPLPQKKTAMTTTTTTTTTSYEDSFHGESSTSHERYRLPETKEKKKTRGTGNTSTASSSCSSTQPVQPTKNYLYIENITSNKHAQDTFNNLFALHPRKNCFYNKVKISVHEINTLFKALKQDFDTSKGHGSHKKGTLNFQDVGGSMEEQMIILTKATYLKPYLISHVREAFFKAGIVPNNPIIIEKLKQAYPDD